MVTNRVLVIEPDVATLRKYTAWLRTEGFDVEAPTSEKEALGLLRTDAASSFHMVLARIPRSAKGFGLMEQIVAARSDLPIVAIAADNRGSVAAIERGALHCLVEPVEAEPLTKMVAFIMNLMKLRAKRAPAMRSHGMSPRPSAGSFSATDAKNHFATILETAMSRGPVFITKHDAPRAVLMALEEFNALAGVPNRRLSGLSAAFDELFDQMQKPGARARMQAAFDAPPEALGEAAVRAARQKD